MDIAAALGAERLREIMADLVNRSALVVERYGGTVDKSSDPHAAVDLRPPEWRF
jgi:class 3 adenylate cyclase